MALDFAKEAIEGVGKYGINFEELKAGKASIKVIGLGGAGCNAITWLYNKGITGATVFAANTDALHLSVCKADEKILIGKELTRGLGCGGYPEKGREAAKEAMVDLKRAVSGADMVFLVAGMGGGTGTGSAPVVAQLSKEVGAVTIGVVTMPFETERARIEKAEFGLQQLREAADTVIVIDNNRLVDIAGNLPVEQAFAVANELIATMIKGIVETITIPSLINLDYADVSSIMKNGDVAVIGIGESDTQNRVEEAVKQALSHPLLDIDYKGATGSLIHVICGEDLKLEELNNIGQLITENLSPDAQVIIGARINRDFKGRVRVITIITGVKSPYVLGSQKREDVYASSGHMADIGVDFYR
ncbi:cell division protein FtsZ [Candidatus Pacearchaeota archaeon]|nr:cell division protein FtsZ [Candidatus Pacearchaeota archaeon]